MRATRFLGERRIAFPGRGFTSILDPLSYCGLGDPDSLNPLRQVLDVLGEAVPAIAYDPLGHYHFPEGTFPVYGNAERYRAAVEQISPQAAAELRRMDWKI